jgi:uncharacterized protein (DUF924 family)
MGIDRLAREVLAFWFGTGEDHGKRHKRWFAKDPAFDAACQRFSGLVEDLLHGKHQEWQVDPRACLARIIALDQFPRQIYRGTARAFGGDALALVAARHAVEAGYDGSMLPVERLFAYLPFEHSESLADQERACELMRPLEHFPETDDALRYAEAHRAIIARFGRFPHRNALLGRASTPEEIDFLKQPGSAF